MPDLQNIDLSLLWEKFRMQALTKSELSRLNYTKAINCLEGFADIYTHSSDFPSEQMLADWFLNMWAQGLSKKTAIHYLDIISALYRGAGLDNSDDTIKKFGKLKARIKDCGKKIEDSPIDDAIFKRILTITKSASYLTGMSNMGLDILMYSLLNGAMALSDVAKVKVEDIDNDDEVISVIVKRNAASNRKYLFPFNQSRRTVRQLTLLAGQMVEKLFSIYNIPIAQSVENTIKLIWAYAALKCGIPGSEINGMLGTKVVGLPELSVCPNADVSPERKSTLTKTVNMLFSDNPPRWYAMKLRPRVEFADVEERVRNFGERIPHPEFFYPYDEIRRRVGKKLVKDTQPVIKDIVFFKLRMTEIFSLFCKIGDMAWCYTTSGRPGGDYAAISRKSFECFQETIGHFTPDYEIAPIGGFEPSEGETVVMLNGPLADCEFEVDAIKDADNVIFQLNMVGNNGFQWRTKASRLQLKRPQ